MGRISSKHSSLGGINERKEAEVDLGQSFIFYNTPIVLKSTKHEKYFFVEAEYFDRPKDTNIVDHYITLYGESYILRDGKYHYKYSGFLKENDVINIGKDNQAPSELVVCTEKANRYALFQGTKLKVTEKGLVNETTTHLETDMLIRCNVIEDESECDWPILEKGKVESAP